MRFNTKELIFGTAGILAMLFVVFFIISYKGPSEPVVSTATQGGVTSTPEAATKETATEVPAGTLKGATTATNPGKVAPVLSGRVAPELVKPTGFTNIDALGFLSTDQITLKKFLGKVVLLEFWTTSSMNSLRMVPYLNMWNMKYHDSGLVILAVHTPRFTFERSKSVVDQFAHDHNMIFPLVIDNEYGTWNAYKNTLWPHEYLINTSGRIVYDHQGEGGYEAMEQKIRSLLTDRAAKLGKPTPSFFNIDTPKDAYKVDLSKVLTPETYFGSKRNQSLAEGTALKNGPQSFEPFTGTQKLNKIYLTGSWNFTDEYASSMAEGAKVSFRYSASAVYAVLGNEGTMKVKVLLDGAPLPQTAAGKDVRYEKNDSVIYVNQERLYDIVNNTVGYGEHTLELIPAAGGLNIFTLTFG